MHNFKKLDIWIKSMSLVKEIYILTNKFPKSEQFGMISQIQRSAVSVPANIAEGSAKSSNKDFSRFLEISMGSACELETLIILSKNLNYIDNNCYESIEKQIQEIQRMIKSFISQLS